MHNLITHIFPAIVKQVSWPSVHVFRVLFLENCFGEEGGGAYALFSAMKFTLNFRSIIMTHINIVLV